MTMAARDDFKARLRSIVSPIPPGFRRRAMRDIKTVLESGVSLRTDLLTILKNKRARANLLIKVCWILGRLGDRRAVPAIISALAHDDARVRQAAAQSLGELGSRRAVPSLVALLRRDKYGDVRGAAASALGALRDGRAFAPLASTLSNQREDPKVRGLAAEALAGLRHRGVAAALIAALSDQSAEVRFWAAFGLGQLRSRRALPDLELLAANDDAVLPGWGAVREEATRAIEYIRHG